MTAFRRDRAREVAADHPFNGNSHEALLGREGWKYVELRVRLEVAGVEHVFEEQIPGAEWFYDLLLPARRLAIEFDGPYHAGPKQRAEDDRKRDHALSHGWQVFRVVTDPAAVIPSSVLTAVLGP